MKKVIIITFILLGCCSNSWACNQESKKLLSKALKIAKALPQKDGLNRKWGNDQWIKPRYSQDGNYRYLIHDISIEFARSQCSDNAFSAIELINNLGVKDSALAQSAIYLAENKQFDESINAISAVKHRKADEIARYGAAEEFIKHGRLKEGQKILYGAGAFDFRYNSAVYTYTMYLAQHGFYDDALEYIGHVGGVHGRNTRGDLIIFFLNKEKPTYAKKIVRIYEANKFNDAPIVQLAIYYSSVGSHKKAAALIEKIKHPNLKVSTYFKMADYAKEKSKSFEYFRKGKDLLEHYIVDDGRDYLIGSNIQYIAKYEGVEKAHLFIKNVLKKDSNLIRSTEYEIRSYLWETKDYEEMLNISNSSEKEDFSYERAIIELRRDKVFNKEKTKRLKNSPLYPNLLFEAHQDGVISAKYVLGELRKTTAYPQRRGEYYQRVAEIFYTEYGENSALKQLEDISEGLFRALWLVGMSRAITQKTKSHLD